MSHTYLLHIGHMAYMEHMTYMWHIGDIGTARNDGTSRRGVPLDVNGCHGDYHLCVPYMPYVPYVGYLDRIVHITEEHRERTQHVGGVIVHETHLYS